MGGRVIQRATILRTQNKEADDFGVIDLEYITDGEEVAQRFGHLFFDAVFLDTDKAVVHPNVGKGAAMGAFGLGNFILMMRELQISTTPMNIKMIAEQSAAHGRTFDVPARTPIAPR